MYTLADCTEACDVFMSFKLWEIRDRLEYIPDPPDEDYCKDCDWKNNPKCNRCVGS